MRKTAFLALAAFPFAAHAADLGAAGGFNAFVFGSASLNGGHADGAIAVGGAVSGSNYTTMLQNAPATVGSDGHVGFYVGGDATFTDKLTVNNAGNARVGGAYSGSNGISLNGGALIQGAGAVNSSLFTTQQAYSTAQSNSLFGLAATPITTTDPNNWSLNVASLSTVYGSAALVSIPATSLSLLRTLDISNLASGETLIIDVTGSAAVSDFGLTVNGAPYDHLLWNYGGSTVNINSRAFHGSLLAPNAAVTTAQNIDGNLIANSWTNNNSAEIHFGTGTRFAGYVPQATPEPATWAALGLGSLAVFRRRRHA